MSDPIPAMMAKDAAEGAFPVAPAAPEVCLTPAHRQKTTLHILECYPSHEPRADDPHYKYFHQALKRIQALGLYKCWICGKTHDEAQLELHHSTVEFALANGVDLTRFEECYPEFGVTSEEAFQQWIEGPENLTVLCLDHHRGIHGVHSLPGPLWVAQRFWRSDLPVPGEIITNEAAKGDSA